ncbi:MAG: hypothetical protein NC206_02585 [Bacteroides sp.]|nr:hypothetical protein [Roseburia sp.]MCM1345950.1 hypothetical protein [Bacteroides sp.]MCM1420314.1 hypothetical protein [Bacteroides sp.]
MLIFKNDLRRNGTRTLKKCLPILLGAMVLGVSVSTHAQEKKKPVLRYSTSSSVPSGYERVGNTMLYYRQTSSSIDFQGCFNSLYYGSTYSNGGYKVAMQVNNGSATQMNCLNGSTVNGVSFSASVEPQGELARVCYTVTNTTEEDVSVSLGTHADVMIGSNDRAPISRRVDTTGSTYGVTMKDGNGAQLCVLFGNGLAGVTSVSDYWFGHYNTNSSASGMVGNYSSGGNYMEENGTYDSGMGWCWKNRNIPAGETVVFSYLIGVGEVNLEPHSSFEVTPEDPEGWNDLSRPHRLTLEGEYESPAGLDGMIEYAIEDSEEWLRLTDMMSSGSTFSSSLVVMFDAGREKHTIRFRTIDNVGNTTMLPPIEYADVSFFDYDGIVGQIYTGDSLFQTVECVGMDSSHIITSGYRDNVNAGLATFYVEGVFPYTIGRKSCSFRIDPAPLVGGIELPVSEFVYDGSFFTPEWLFTDESNNLLIEDVDYSVTFDNNRYPGVATVSVSGKGNYTSTLSESFYIDKAALTDDLYIVMLPQEDICFDGNEHQALCSSVEGVGETHFMYVRHDDMEVLSGVPVEEGVYDIYMEIDDGYLYYGKSKEYLGSFTIYCFDDTEWAALNALYAELVRMGGNCNWNISDGIKSVSSFDGLTIRQGHLVGINLSGMSLSGTLPLTLANFTHLESLDLSSNNLSGNLPEFLIALKMQNLQAFSVLGHLDISNNKFEGNVGALAYCLPELTALNASQNKFEDVYPMLSPNITDLDISCQDMNRIVDLDLSKLSIDEMAAKIPTILLYDHDNQKYRTEINLFFTTADLSSCNLFGSDEWAMLLTVADNRATIPYISAQNAFHGKSGDLLNVVNMNADNTIEGSTLKVALSFEQGDANFVNGVDAADLQATILYAFGGYLDKPFNYTAADTYQDSNINVQDVICTVNILLEDTVDSLDALMSKSRRSQLEESVADFDSYIYMDGNHIVFHSDVPVASLSVKAVGNIKWDLEKYGMIQSVYKSNVVGYSLRGATLPVNEDIVIGECGSNARISSVSMSDIDANMLNVSVVNNPVTSVNHVDVEKGEVEIYGISGVRRDALMKGVNIIRYKGKTGKIFNK